MNKHTVPVFELLTEDGTLFGVGTQLELDHWRWAGVFPKSIKRGRTICYEDPALDRDREAAWKGTARKDANNPG